MSDIAAADWDACGTADHPLLQHRHLRLLEDCGLAAPDVGVHPHYLILRDADGTVAGAAPAYLKTSSRGELAVDLGLPLAHMRAAGPYYPKIQVEVPMTPNLGPRLLVRPAAEGAADGDAQGDRVRAALLGALREMAVRADAASVQISFMTDADQRAAVAAGFLPSEGNVFVWHDRGKTDFDAFVDAMSSPACRSQIRRDRRRAAELGLRFVRLDEDEITADLAPRIFEFYKSTFDRHGSTPFLTPAYFAALFRDMPDAVYLMVAIQDDDWVAMALGIEGRHCVLSQHWGQAGSHRWLIFEMFYREMEYAFAHGLDDRLRPRRRPQDAARDRP